MRMFTSMLKGAAVAAFVFALAWIRSPLALSTLSSTLGHFIGFGMLFAILAMLVGVPLALAMEKCRIGFWWSYTLVAATVGALISAGLGHHPSGPVQNPHGGAVFSPWTRDRPGIDSFPVSSTEYISSILFCATVGGILGLAFWYFYSRRLRPDSSWSGPSD